jgi:hypothetical protein
MDLRNLTKAKIYNSEQDSPDFQYRHEAKSQGPREQRKRRILEVDFRVYNRHRYGFLGVPLDHNGRDVSPAEDLRPPCDPCGKPNNQLSHFPRRKVDGFGWHLDEFHES